MSLGMKLLITVISCVALTQEVLEAGPSCRATPAACVSVDQGGVVSLDATVDLGKLELLDDSQIVYGMRQSKKLKRGIENVLKNVIQMDHAKEKLAVNFAIQSGKQIHSLSILMRLSIVVQDPKHLQKSASKLAVVTLTPRLLGQLGKKLQSVIETTPVAVPKTSTNNSETVKKEDFTLTKALLQKMPSAVDIEKAEMLTEGIVNLRREVGTLESDIFGDTIVPVTSVTLDKQQTVRIEALPMLLVSATKVRTKSTQTKYGELCPDTPGW